MGGISELRAPLRARIGRSAPVLAPGVFDALSAKLAAVALPVIADADTGYGNALNVQRYEQAGAAALHLEDQPFPKRCGHYDRQEVIAAGEMVGKLRAALDARTDPNLLIIARTDARAGLTPLL